MNKRDVGAKYEKIIKKYLKENGCEIVELNYHFHKIGEIDIIFYDFVKEYGEEKRYLCFGEVKYRKSNTSYSSLEAIDYKKQKQISKVAVGYLKEKGISFDIPIRFDAFGIKGSQIEWIKNAFYFVK